MSGTISGKRNKVLLILLLNVLLCCFIQGPWVGLKGSRRETRKCVAVVTKQCSPLLSFLSSPTHTLLLSSGVDSLGVPTGEERGQGWLHLSMWWALVPSATGAGGRGKKARVEWEGNGCFRAVIWDSEWGRGLRLKLGLGRGNGLREWDRDTGVRGGGLSTKGYARG